MEKVLMLARLLDTYAKAALSGMSRSEAIGTAVHTVYFSNPPSTLVSMEDCRTMLYAALNAIGDPMATSRYV
jgi:hypothetical protein